MIKSRIIAGAPLFGSEKFWEEFDRRTEEEFRKLLYKYTRES